MKDVDEGEDEEEDKIEGTMDEKVFRDTRSDERNASMVVYTAQIYTMICNIFLPKVQSTVWKPRLAIQKKKKSRFFLKK